MHAVLDLLVSHGSDGGDGVTQCRVPRHRVAEGIAVIHGTHHALVWRRRVAVGQWQL